MRTLTTFLVGLVCVIALAACGGSSSSSSTPPDYTLPASSEPKPTSLVSLGGAMQGGGSLAFNNYSVSTFTGSVAGFKNYSIVTNPPAKFNRPLAVTSDSTHLYVVDYLSNLIRKIDIASRMDVTLSLKNASSFPVSLNLPRDVTSFGGYLYVADTGYYVIRKIDKVTGISEIIAGAEAQPGYVDAINGLNARFNVINGITTDGKNLYVTDSSNTIRRIDLIDPNHRVTTLAGSSGKTGSTDGVQSAALFNLPNRITTDGPNLYVTDFNNGIIRKIVITTGEVTTIAGKARAAGDPGDHQDSTISGEAARFYQPNGITTDGNSLYVTDSYDHSIRKISLAMVGAFSGPVETIGGISTVLTGALQEGKKDVSKFYRPIGITTDGVHLYITDNQNHRIRRIE